MKDSMVIDTTELKLNWAVDEIAEELAQLMDYLEGRADVEGFERFCAVIRAINNFNKLAAPKKANQ